MIGTSGIGNTPGDRHDAHKLGTVEERHLPVEEHHVGPDGAKGVERGNAVARFVDILDAAIDQEIADHLAHILIVVDHQHAQRLDAIRQLFLRQLGRHCRPHRGLPLPCGAAGITGNRCLAG
jgi:hypothetical protein